MHSESDLGLVIGAPILSLAMLFALPQVKRLPKS